MNTKDIVTPMRPAYRKNRPRAMVGDILFIAAEIAITRPNWAIMIAQNRKLPPNKRSARPSELATKVATTAVISRPPVIHR